MYSFFIYFIFYVSVFIYYIYTDDELRKGKRLTLEQHNIRLLHTQHTYGKQYECLTCTDEYDVEKIVVLTCQHYMCVDK